MPFTGPAEDRLAIRELIDAYADAVCCNDAAAWGALWTEDAEWSLPDIPALGTTQGRDAIVALWTAAMQGFAGVVFVASPGSIEVDGDRAIVRSYASEVFEQSGATVRQRGRYDDLCVRTGGQWRFERRVFRVLHREV